MIKRIIFDIDDTIIPFPKEFVDGYNNVLKKHNLSISASKLYEIIGEYETCGEYEYYDKEKLLKLINDRLNINLSEEFIEDFFNMYNKLVSKVEDGLEDTLKYLSSKYELVALSNWFTHSQSERLKCVGLYKYFNHVYGSDLVPMKPRRESFLAAIGDNKVEECLMVGDNYNMDIKVPMEMGMNVYYLTQKETDVPSIKKISDLKDVL